MDVGAYRAELERLGFGKRLPMALYVHVDGAPAPDGPLGELVTRLRTAHGLGPEFNVLKFRTDELKVSFLSYPGFVSEAHPALAQAVTVDLATGKVRHMDYLDKANPPILHRKEAFLPADHPLRAPFAALTQAEEEAGLYAEPGTIGFKLNWERLLREKGLRIEGHTLTRVEPAGPAPEPTPAENWQRAGRIPFLKMGASVLYPWSDSQKCLERRSGCCGNRKRGRRSAPEPMLPVPRDVFDVRSERATPLKEERPPLVIAK